MQVTGGDPARAPVASVIITSYNYGRFLAETIQSALDQTYSRTEVIVVDDGSTDESRDVISRFAGRIKAVLKENGGQASAMNAGLRICNGHGVCFVDSDDLLTPAAMERAMERLTEGVAKVHWPLHHIDESGAPTGTILGEQDLAQGDVRDIVIARGPDGYAWPPTSGNLWLRSFLEEISPIPEDHFVIGPDVYLSALVPFYGTIAKLEAPHGAYRLHTSNNTCREPLNERVRSAIQLWEHSFDALERHCVQSGVAAQRDQWAANSWWHCTGEALNAILDKVPQESSILLLDANEWAAGTSIAGRRCFSFLERDGQYWGPPPNDAVAISELKRMRNHGVQYVVVVPAAFWWLDYYSGFSDYLFQRFPTVHRDGRVIIVDLQTNVAPRGQHASKR